MAEVSVRRGGRARAASGRSRAQPAMAAMFVARGRRPDAHNAPPRRHISTAERRFVGGQRP